MSWFWKYIHCLKGCLTHEVDGFLLQDGYLFCSHMLCIPCTSLREFLVWELHAGGLAVHFGRNKTIKAVEHHFYWPSIKRDITRLVSQCHTCQLTKQQKQNTSLYTPLPVPNCLWQNINMNFVLGPLKTARKYNFILVVVDHFFKMVNFLPCSKTSVASRIANIYFDEVVRLHELPKTIVSDMEVKFTSYFWKIL